MHNKIIHYINFRITIDKYERNTLLTIRRAVRNDSGKYTLVLKNSSGAAEKEAEVIVLGNSRMALVP